MTRIFILFSLFLIKSGIIFGQTKLPNIIILLSDDQGWGDLSINGNKNLNRDESNVIHFFQSIPAPMIVIMIMIVMLEIGMCAYVYISLDKFADF